MAGQAGEAAAAVEGVVTLAAALLPGALGVADRVEQGLAPWRDRVGLAGRLDLLGVLHAGGGWFGGVAQHRGGDQQQSGGAAGGGGSRGPVEQSADRQAGAGRKSEEPAVQMSPAARPGIPPLDK